MEFLIALLILTLIPYIIIKYIKEGRKEKLKLETKLRQLARYVTENEQRIVQANKSFENLLNIDRGYFSNYSRFEWNRMYNDIYESIDFQILSNLKLRSSLKSELTKFINYFKNSAEYRNQFNDEFLDYELKKYKAFFDDIEGKSLDLQQRKAIIKNEDNSLVIAGAGTGKTITIAGKVAYLINRFLVDPSEILLISFTNKSCDVMKERIRKKMNINVDVRTFNKLGFDIIKEVDAENHKSVCDLKKREIMQIFSSFLTHLMEDQFYLNKLNRFFIEYLKPYKEDDEFESKGEKIQYLREQHLYGYKTVYQTRANGESYNYRERLKSQEEVEIANFLFLNGIEYIYEAAYKHNVADRKHSQYKPDFYLPVYDIYLEHFAIDKNGNVPSWFKGSDEMTASEKYNKGIEWKRNLHNENETRLIETYSWEKKEGVLLKNLNEKLKQNGIEIEPKSPEEIWNLIKEVADEEVSKFVQLLHTFLVLYKSNNYTFDKVRRKIDRFTKNHQYMRNGAFLEIFEPVFHKYEEFLNERGEIDFSDMINIAAYYIKEREYTPKFKYIIIDEFQDISLGRYNLIKCFLDSNPGSKLFCVGDDWQSIYRFTGSDMSIFTEFEKYFKGSPISGFTRETEIHYIETTYRFAEPLIDLTSNFILKNKKQIEKNLTSYTSEDGKPISILYYDNAGTPITTQVENILDQIIQMEGPESSAEVLFLGRYNHDIKPLMEMDDLKFVYDRADVVYNGIYSKANNLNIRFLTVHASKGMESDYVIILNANSGKFGFPSEIVDDPIMDLLLNDSDQYPNGEERRVFYVAMTRTRKHLYLVANEKYKSKFIVEIEEENDDSSVKCPSCKTGNIGVKSGRNGEFKGCSNYPYCSHTESMPRTNDEIRLRQHS